MYQYCFIFLLTPPPLLSFSAVDLICRHIAAIVNRHRVHSACCFSPINKSHWSTLLPSVQTNGHARMRRGPPAAPHLFTHTELTLRHMNACARSLPLVRRGWYDLYESHTYNKTSCLTVAVVVVLHYLHATNAWTTFSPFIFKYCWDICEDFMSFYWVLLMFFPFLWAVTMLWWCVYPSYSLSSLVIRYAFSTEPVLLSLKEHE